MEIQLEEHEMMSGRQAYEAGRRAYRMGEERVRYPNFSNAVKDEPDSARISLMMHWYNGWDAEMRADDDAR